MTTHKACKHCAQLLPSDAQFCPNCGATTSDSTPRACPRCGQSNPGTARFCQQCGTGLLEPAAPPSGGGASQTAPQAKPAWGQVALGGLGGLLLGQLFGGRGGFGGYGDNDDFGGGGGFGGGDIGGGDFGGGGDGG